MIRLFAWAVLVSFRAFRVIHGGARALFEGFWLGVLPESTNALLTIESYGAGSVYTADQWIDSGLQCWEELAIGRHFPPSGRVLVAAAGGGREMIALARAGYQVEGFECSPAMVEAGQKALIRRGIDARLQWAPPSRLPSLTSEYNAAIIGWNAWSYMVPAAVRIEFLTELGQHLSKGAPVLLSAGVVMNFRGAAEWTPWFANLFRRLTFRKPNAEKGMSFPTRPRQDFTKGKLQAEILQAGFTLEQWYQWGPFGAAIVRKP